MKTCDDDTLAYMLSPDASLVIDASGCIVLVTPERRVTVTNVAAWQAGLSQAKAFQEICLEDAESGAAWRAARRGGGG